MCASDHGPRKLCRLLGIRCDRGIERPSVHCQRCTDQCCTVSSGSHIVRRGLWMRRWLHIPYARCNLLNNVALTVPCRGVGIHGNGRSYHGRVHSVHFAGRTEPSMQLFSRMCTGEQILCQEKQHKDCIFSPVNPDCYHAVRACTDGLHRLSRFLPLCKWSVHLYYR